MASFRKRGKKWSYTISLGIDPVTKKQKQVYASGFSTKKEAAYAAAKAEKSVYEETYVKESKILFKDLVNEWLIHYSKRVKESSFNNRRKALKKLTQTFGDYQVNKITRKMYQERLDDLSNSCKHNYLSSIHSAGKMVFDYAEMKNLIKVNPTKHFIMPKKKDQAGELDEDVSRDKFFEKDELGDFLKLTEKIGLKHDYIMFLTFAYTGIRLGELLALQWSDIDFQKKTIHIRKTLYNPKNNKSEYKLGTTKTKGSTRKFLVDDYLLEALKNHKNEQLRESLLMQEVYHDKDFVFTNDEGYPRTPTHVRNRLNRILKYSQTSKKIVPHSFRHTYTSLLIEADVNTKVIQDRLGHTDISTTMNIYAKMTTTMESEAAEKFNQLMKGFV